MFFIMESCHFTLGGVRGIYEYFISLTIRWAINVVFKICWRRTGRFLSIPQRWCSHSHVSLLLAGIIWTRDTEISLVEEVFDENADDSICFGLPSLLANSLLWLQLSNNHCSGNFLVYFKLNKNFSSFSWWSSTW